MCLKQEVLVIKEIGTVVVNNEEVKEAEGKEEYCFQGADHHLIDSTGHKNKEHGVGEVLWEVRCLSHVTHLLHQVLMSIDNGDVL